MKTIHSKEYRQFLTCLTQARIDAGFTQQGLAHVLGRPQSFVSKYENAERRLDVVEFIQVCRAMNVDAAEFIRKLLSSPGP